MYILCEETKFAEKKILWENISHTLANFSISSSKIVQFQQNTLVGIKNSTLPFLWKAIYIKQEPRQIRYNKIVLQWFLYKFEGTNLR